MFQYLPQQGLPLGLAVILIAALTFVAQRAISNLYFHPLSRFPGPKIAACTPLYKAYIEVIAEKSFMHHLIELHKVYGEVIRVGPNELHFCSPSVYYEIYNPSNKWDKEKSLYRSFREDRSSFGFLTYKEAKERKDVLNRMFSRKSIGEAQGILREKIDALCNAFAKQGNKPVDLFYAFRCFSVDVITYLCFGQSVDAINEPDFAAPIIVAMDASNPVFVRFKHSSTYRDMIMNCPPNISNIVSPATAGLVNLQQLLKKQIAEITDNPETLKNLPHSTTIYHELLRPEAYRNGTAPGPGSLYEESQALMFGGADTTGTTSMNFCFNVLKHPEVYAGVKKELLQAWPNLNRVPDLSELEKLPYLTAVIKETLRMSPGVASPLPRIVPAQGAKIAGERIPGGSIVGMSSYFVHRSSEIFENPDTFNPNRWLGSGASKLDQWLLSFSRGPRSCLGINLAWAELYICFSHVFRKFDMKLDPSSPDKLIWRDCFLAEYKGPHLKAKMTPVTA